MTIITRYDTVSAVKTPLDPLEDVTSWITGLRSTGYVSDLLRTKHKFSNRTETRSYARLISTFAQNSVGLLEQAYSGPEEVSFLPLYYCILNLSKIYIALSINRTKLSTNRYHGATYSPLRKASRDLLTEEITLKPNGTLPLLYSTLTGTAWTKEIKICIGEVYGYIRHVSHEFSQAYGKPAPITSIQLEIRGDSKDGFFLSAKRMSNTPEDTFSPRYLKVLSGFHPDNPTKPTTYLSNKVDAKDITEASPLLLKHVRRYLLWDDWGITTGIYSHTPVSSRRLVLPEEFPIWIVFFHLSNVVRYKPEFLAKLQDSKAWALLLALRKQAMLRFLVLFWSYLNQSSFLINSE